MKEYLNLTRDRLRPAQLTVLVPGTKTDARKDEVPVDERLWPWIDRAVPAPLKEGRLRIYWRRAVAYLELGDLRPYDLRHLSAQLAADTGLNDRDVAVHLRHANAAISTQRYTRRTTARAAAKAIGGALADGAPPLTKVAS